MGASARKGADGPDALAPRESGLSATAPVLITPEWAAPPGVGAAMSTRAGGVSAAPWASMNLGTAVGDRPEAVAENRRRFVEALGVRVVWPRQVHGTHVMQLVADAPESAREAADAVWTRERGLACVVGAADCLPVLFAAADGRAVAAAHAGWRGLAAGVLEATVAALRSGAGLGAEQILAWLGPCIGPRHFEVGAEVLQAFGEPAAGTDNERFRYTPRADGAPRWHADLPLLAAERLRRAGVVQIAGGAWCTHADTSQFFSFRRDGRTGRMAAAIWRR